jgi:hypothetical protein
VERAFSLPGLFSASCWIVEADGLMASRDKLQLDRAY